MNGRDRDTLAKELIERYELPRNSYDLILQKIVSRHTWGVTSIEHPTLIILGAQPGAGKTELQLVAENNLLLNAVVCNADLFRDYHPLASEIKRNYPQLYPQITAKYAQRWNNDLCEYCQINRLNYILETTFSSGNRINETIQIAKENNYAVDIYLLAVPAKLSRLGTQIRFEQTYKDSGLGRRVSREDHDSRFNALSSTLKLVERSRLYNNLYLYGRSITMLQEEAVNGVTLIACNPEHPLEVFEQKLKLSWPDKMQRYYHETCEKVLRYMHDRNASEKEINQFKLDVGLTSPTIKNKKKKGFGL